MFGSRFHSRIDKYNETTSFLTLFPHSFFGRGKTGTYYRVGSKAVKVVLVWVAAEQGGRWMKRDTGLKFYSFVCKLDG